MATRFYLPSSGAAAVSPAVDAYWSFTSGFDRLAMSATPANTANGSKGTTETVSGNVHALVRQYVGPNDLAAGAIEGSFQTSIRAEESNNDAQMFLDLVIKVVSSDGSTVRGVLYAGQGTYTSSSSSSSPQDEFDPTPTRRSRILSGALSAVTAQANDRIVVEFGYSDSNLNATGRTGTLHFGDSNADTDLSYAVDTGDDSNRPWLEFEFGTEVAGSQATETDTANAGSVDGGTPPPFHTTQRRHVLLVVVEERSGELRGFPEQENQQPGRQRIQGTGVAGLPRPQQALGCLQRRVGGDAARLVDEDRAVHYGFGFVESIRRDRWSPRSTDSSYSKRISGVV
jgi:hypothetical protein